MNLYFNFSAFLFSIVLLVSLSTVVYAQNSALTQVEDTCKSKPDSALCSEYNKGSADTNPVVSIIRTITTLLAYAGGLAAFFFVMYGGFKYISSNGNTEKASDGRKTLIAALAVLIVIFLAREIILFVISKLIQ